MNTVKTSLFLVALGCLGIASNSQAMLRQVSINGNNNVVVINANVEAKYRAEKTVEKAVPSAEVYAKISRGVQDVKQHTATVNALRQQNQMKPFGVMEEVQVVTPRTVAYAERDLYYAKYELAAAKAELNNYLAAASAQAALNAQVSDQVDASAALNKSLTGAFDQAGIYVEPAQGANSPVKAKVLRQSQKDKKINAQKDKKFNVHNKNSSKFEISKEDTTVCGCGIQ